MKNKGFTLAEVLITLGIIGVAAAMTMPSLINDKRNKELYTALKKNYSVVQQALLMMENNEGDVVNWCTFPRNEFRLSFKKYFSGVIDCGLESCVGHGGVDADGNAVTWMIKNYKTYNRKKNIVTSFFDDGQYKLTDGAMIFIENPKTVCDETSHMYITVDVNGIGKPNVWGLDMFTFQQTKNGKLLPMGAEGTDYTDLNQYCSLTSSNAMNGIACTQKALTDKNYWK